MFFTEQWWGGWERGEGAGAAKGVAQATKTARGGVCVANDSGLATTHTHIPTQVRCTTRIKTHSHSRQAREQTVGQGTGRNVPHQMSPCVKVQLFRSDAPAVSPGLPEPLPVAGSTWTRGRRAKSVTQNSPCHGHHSRHPHARTSRRYTPSPSWNHMPVVGT